MKYVAILLIVLSCLRSNAQKDSLIVMRSGKSAFSQDSTLKYLEMGDDIFCGYFGRANKPVKNFRKFQKLVEAFPTDSLISLSQGDYNLSLRIYTTWALLLRNYDQVEIVAESLLRDTNEIAYSCGCLANQMYPVNQFVYLLFSGEIDLSAPKLSNKKLREIKSQYHIPKLKEKFREQCNSATFFNSSKN